jgi:YegS/Rv2252/BmrU family lipid kinase
LRILVVSNAASGSSDDASLERVIDRLQPLGDVQHLQAGSQDSFDEDVRGATEPGDLVVVAGGDGTVNCTVNALADSLADYTLAVVPMGTGNDFARTLGMDEDPEAAASQIAAGSSKEFDVGRAKGGEVERLFLNACVGGFPIEVDRAIEGGLKKRLGPLAFWVGGIKAATDLSKWDVNVSGKAVGDCVAVGIGNGRTAGGGIQVWPDADPGDGALDACAIAAENFAKALATALKARGGEHVDRPDVYTSRGAEIRVDSDPPLEFNVDGEVLGLKTPVVFSVAGKVKVRL